MPQQFKLDSAGTAKQSQAKPKADLKSSAPIPLTVAIVVLVLIALGAAGWYTYNGGWKTEAQQAKEWRDEGQPIFLATKGNFTLLNKKNAERAKEGLPPLQLPKGFGHGLANTKPAGQ